MKSKRSPEFKVGLLVVLCALMAILFAYCIGATPAHADIPIVQGSTLSDDAMLLSDPYFRDHGYSMSEGIFFVLVGVVIGISTTLICMTCLGGQKESPELQKVYEEALAAINATRDSQISEIRLAMRKSSELMQNNKGV